MCTRFLAIFDRIFGWGLRTPIYGKRPSGSGMVPFERALVSSYRPSMVTFFSIFTRFRGIAAFVLQHATFSPPTSSLLQISPMFP